VKFYRFKKIKKNRRILAEIMGLYTIKGRIFARIKLNLFCARKLKKIGLIDKTAKKQRLAGSHIREFKRLNQLKIFYHR
jgi:hypothetical protein